MLKPARSISVSVLLLCGVLLFTLTTAIAHAARIDEQRLFYRLALSAISKNDQAALASLQQQLVDYPLYPYLLYATLSRRLAQAPDTEVENFLAMVADTPLAARLRGAWLRQLLRQGRWRRFLEEYDGRDVPALVCYQQRALIRAGRLAGVVEKAKALWRVGKSQDQACDPLFEWLRKRGELTQQLIWERIRIAMDEGNVQLATWLNKQMKGSSRDWIALWIEIHKDPRKGLRNGKLAKDARISRMLIAHGVKQLALDDVDDGWTYWRRLSRRYRFGAVRRGEVERRLALIGAYRHHAQAPGWLNSLPAQEIDRETATWRVRSALRAQDWRAVKQAIAGLSETERKEDEWQYWRARAEAETGNKAAATAIYARLATQRSYHGFLAADKIGRPYVLLDQPLATDPAESETLARLPAMVRAHELVRLEEYADAWREVDLLIDKGLQPGGLQPRQVEILAGLATAWGWHFGAISLAARADHLDALHTRFPTPHRKLVSNAATRQRIDDAWIYGIMRRESAFRPDARSGAGALGLMQLLPATARQTAKRLGMPRPGRRQILDAGNNIALGSAYLRQMLDRFGGNPVLASAAYNAGPGRVRDWLPTTGSLPTDIWIDTIVFDETRDYVRAILAYTAIFEWRLGRKVTRLADRIPPWVYSSAP